MIINGILSTSSTFIIGIIIFLFIIFINLFKNKYYKQDVINLKMIFILLNIIKPDLIRFAFNDILIKLEGNGTSGSLRLKALQTHLDIALKFPILGVGFGSVRSYDLITTWMSSIGLIGTSVFILYLMNIVHKYHVISNKSPIKNLYRGYSHGILIIFIAMFISVPEPYYLFIWISFSVYEKLYILE